MEANRALIVFVQRKHKQHKQLVAQLSAQGYEVEELALPSEHTGTCSAKALIEEKVQGLKLVIVYLSAEIAANVCLGVVMATAALHAIRVIALWLDEPEIIDIPQSVDSVGDCVTTYSDDLSTVFSGEDNPWTLADGSTPPKRKISKHTCG